MPWVTWLAEAAALTGYPVTEVGAWKQRGHGPMRAVEGVIGHHTGTQKTKKNKDDDYPSLKIVRDGRSDLDGPLANLGLGRSGHIYVIAAGACYHAGNSEYDGFTNLNDEFLGIEAENDGSGDWTDEQLDAYPKLVGALLHRMRRSVERYASHRTVATPAGRKPDPAKISDDWMRGCAEIFMNELGNGVPALGRSHSVLPKVTTPRVLGRGDHGDDVEDLQRVLNAWYGNVKVDGVFGDQTERAVRRAQLNVPPQPKLEADGRVGPLTRKKLGL